MKIQTIFFGEHFSDKAKEAKFCPPWWAQILLFILVFNVAQTPASIISIVAAGIAYALEAKAQGIEPELISEIELSADANAWLMVIQLMLTVTTAAIVIVYCRVVERRSFHSMGFVKNGAVPSYFIGLIVGFMLFSATLLISFAAGAVKYIGTDISNGVMLVLLCAGWLLQGAEEEIVCRGYFMPSLSTKMPLWAAVLISSLFFSLMHLFNEGFNLIVLVNLTLTGIMFAVFAIRFNNLWVCCAVHSMWNLVQGNFYGLPVSGIFTGPSVFRFELLDVSELWTGGEFGLEGSLSETIVMVVVIAAITFIPKRKKVAT